MGTTERVRTRSVHSRPTVIAAVRDDEWRTHVVSHLTAWASITFVLDPRELPAAATATTAAVALWHLSRPSDVDEECGSVIAQLRRAAPGIRVVGYCQVSRSVAPLLLAAGRVGIDGLLMRGFDDLTIGLRKALDMNGPPPYTGTVLSQLRVTRIPAGRLLARCLEDAASGPISVESLAKQLRVSRRTLRNWLHQAGLPAPEVMISWSRVFAVAHALEDANRSISAVARALRFSSGSDMRRMVMRYVGCTPTELRERGGVAAVTHALDAQISARQRTGAPRA